MKNKRRKIEIIREMLVGVREESEVSQSVLDYYEEMRFCLGLLLKGYSQQTIISLMEEERGIKYSTAWRLIRETEDVFGSQTEVDKRVKRLIASEMAQRSYEVAEGKGNSRAMTAATNAFIKTWGLDRDDPDLPDFSKLDTPANILVIDDRVASKLNALPEGGSIDLNNLIDEVAEDIEHEELNTEPAGPDQSGD
jgi:hypothetical protein